MNELGETDRIQEERKEAKIERICKSGLIKVIKRANNARWHKMIPSEFPQALLIQIYLLLVAT